MNIHEVISFILSTEVDVSASFLYRMVEDYGEGALLDWFMSQQVGGSLA